MHYYSLMRLATACGCEVHCCSSMCVLVPLHCDGSMSVVTACSCEVHCRPANVIAPMRCALLLLNASSGPCDHEVHCSCSMRVAQMRSSLLLLNASNGPSDHEVHCLSSMYLALNIYPRHGPGLLIGLMRPMGDCIHCVHCRQAQCE